MITSKYGLGIVIGGIVTVYLLINLVVPNISSVLVGCYVMQPILWSGLFFVALRASWRGTGRKLKFSRQMLLVGVLLGVVQITVLIFVGLLTGLGNSAYSHTPYGMFLNFTLFVSALLGTEFSRAFLLSAFERWRGFVVMAFVALLYTLFMMPMARFGNQQGAGEAFSLFGGTFIPLLAENSLACFLALTGGPMAAIGYRGILEFFEWASPVLPDFPWNVWAFAGTLVPLIGLFVTQALFAREAHADEAKEMPHFAESVAAGDC